MAISLEADYGMLEVEWRGAVVKIDPYEANDRFTAIMNKYQKEKEEKGELPVYSELYPLWASHYLSGDVKTTVAVRLHQLVLAEIDAEKKAEPGSDTPG